MGQQLSLSKAAEDFHLQSEEELRKAAEEFKARQADPDWGGVEHASLSAGACAQPQTESEVITPATLLNEQQKVRRLESKLAKQHTNKHTTHGE